MLKIHAAEFNDFLTAVKFPDSPFSIVSIFTKLSAELIYNQIRWLKYMQHGNDGFKINNNFKAFYARKFMKEFPVYNGIFELRKSKFDEDN